MNIAILSGELSGDAIGADLARHLKHRDPAIALWGLGSAGMRSAGVELVADSASWGAIGITQSLARVPALFLTTSPMLRGELLQRRPDAVILIDFAAFNVRAARFCHRAGIPVCYYFPPASWNSKGHDRAGLKDIASLIAVPFPWCTARYKGGSARVEFVGHPVLDRAVPSLGRQAFAAKFGIDAGHPIFALLPGSRMHEIRYNLPVLLDAARIITTRIPGAQFVIGAAASLPASALEDILKRESPGGEAGARSEHDGPAGMELLAERVESIAHAMRPSAGRSLATPDGVTLPETALRDEANAGKRSDRLRHLASRALPPLVVVRDMPYDVMGHADVALTCAGTATLECAVLGTPMVIMYRGSAALQIESMLRKTRRTIRFIGLPNIIAGESIVPELIQEQATAERLAEEAIPMFTDYSIRFRIKENLRAVRESLGSPGAGARTADLVLEMARAGKGAA